MDFDAAIQAHNRWKLKLLAAVMSGNSKDNLDPRIVSKDDACELGQWIHGEARSRLAALPEYQELVKVHADFHLHVGALITRIDGGEVERIAVMLTNPSSVFSQDSNRLVDLLSKMKAAYEPR